MVHRGLKGGSYVVHRWFEDNSVILFALPSKNGHKNPFPTRHGFCCCPARHYAKRGCEFVLRACHHCCNPLGHRAKGKSSTLVKTSLNPMPNVQVCVYLTVHITKLQLQTTFSKLFVFLSTSRFTKAISLSGTMKMNTASWPSNLRTVAVPCTSSHRSTSCPLSMQSRTCLEKN